MTITTDAIEFRRYALALATQPRLVTHKSATIENPGHPTPSRWPRLLRKRDLAEYLSVSTGTIDAWLKSGVLPRPDFDPSPRLIRWDRRILDAHLDSRSGKASDPTDTADTVIQRFRAKSSGARC